MYADSSYSALAIGVVIMVVALNKVHVLLHDRFLK